MAMHIYRPPMKLSMDMRNNLYRRLGGYKVRGVLKELYSLPGKALKKIHWKIVRKSLKRIGCFSNMGASFDIRGGQFIEIGECFNGGNNVILEAWDSYRGERTGYTPTLIIGNNVTISSYCHISCGNSIVIGNGVLLGPNVFICDNMHGGQDELDIPPIERKLKIGAPVKIGDNVWIGLNACIMNGVSIGDSARIGANAVVTHNVPAKSVAVGVPAEQS